MNIEDIKGRAWSFPTLKPPDAAELIAIDRREDETWYFYTNPDPIDAREHPYLYETASGYRIKAEMEAATKRIKEKERKKRCDV